MSEQMIGVRGIALGNEPGCACIGRKELYDGSRVDVLAALRALLARSLASRSSVMSGSAMIASIRCHPPVEGEETSGRRNGVVWSGPTRFGAGPLRRT